jgi:hypothetical protein
MLTDVFHFSAVTYKHTGKKRDQYLHFINLKTSGLDQVTFYNQFRRMN